MKVYLIRHGKTMGNSQGRYHAEHRDEGHHHAHDQEHGQAVELCQKVHFDPSRFYHTKAMV